MKLYKKQYLLQYKDNNTSELKEYSFTAKNDEHAQLIAMEYCDVGWHKYYGILRVK